MRKSVHRRLGAAFVACAVLLTASACSTLVGAGAAPDIYDLTVPSSFDSVRGRIGAQLLVPVPSAVAALATNRIAVRPEPAQIAYYPGAVWSDELPTLVQLKLVRAFENSGRARAVGRPGESLAIDYQVIVDVRAFEVDVAEGGAHVVLGVKLLDDRTGRVRATKVFEARVAASGAAANGAVEALDRAADQAMTDIVTWTATVI